MSPGRADLRYVTSADGTAIALEQVTDGPRTLVTIPGGTDARALWGEVARNLDGAFAVWSMDRRGKGDSGDAGPYSFEREHEDLAAVARAFDGEALPHATVVELPGQGHAAVQTAPHLVSDAIRRAVVSPV